MNLSIDPICKKFFLDILDLSESGKAITGRILVVGEFAAVFQSYLLECRYSHLLHRHKINTQTQTVSYRICLQNTSLIHPLPPDFACGINHMGSSFFYF